MPTSQNGAIFMLTTDKTDCVTPCACLQARITWSIQSLSQQSKTFTNVADQGSASSDTVQYMPFCRFFLFYLGHLSFLGL